MLLPVLLALATGADPSVVGLKRGPDPVRAEAELRAVDSEMRSMSKGVCVDLPRKAELSQVAADYRLLKFRLARDYPQSATPERIWIHIDDRRDCDEYENYARYRDAARLGLI